jgi:Endonuclease-reverse transcriptase
MTDNTKVSIIQHNTARTSNVMYSVLEIAKESATDFVLIQEPSVAFDNNNNVIIISHSTYNCILPRISNNIRSRVAIYAKKQSVYKFCQRTDLTADSDIIIIDVSGPNIETFQIINIYNEKSLNPDSDSTDYTVKRSLHNIQITKETVICGDFNAHHSWWNSSIVNSVRSDSLISWLNLYNFDLISESDIATFHRSSAHSVIDLTFATKNLQIFDWHIDDFNATGSDHELIKFNIRTKAAELADNLACSDFFNFKKAD